MIRRTEAGHIACDAPHCRRHAVRVVGATLQIATRHDGETHITVLSVAELVQLLDRSGALVAK